MRSYKSTNRGGKLIASLSEVIEGNIGIRGVWIDVENRRVVRKFTTMLESEAEAWYESCMLKLEAEYNIHLWR